VAAEASRNIRRVCEHVFVNRTTGEAMSTSHHDLQQTIVARLGAAPGGLEPRALLAGLPAPEAQVALGLLIVAGRVDEVGGRLSLTLLERRAV
jgi:hypothetical protein